jgi:hypothetical protein
MSLQLNLSCGSNRILGILDLHAVVLHCPARGNRILCDVECRKPFL